ncbi:MAG: YeeE/YedE family protein [Deltaproteobacteria bacterium]|nr:YeeE/YedE family protein [Deltaproteobacteria bacterium]
MKSEHEGRPESERREIERRARARPYWNPYLSGVFLGVVLFGSYVVTGHGLGASGGLARAVTAALKLVTPSSVDHNGFFASLGGGARSPLDSWIVWEILGVMIGGAFSGLLGRRFFPETQRGPRLSRNARWVIALAGGLIVGWSTQLSRGCTSGQALSGGAVLAAGSWAFMFSVFGGAYLVAYPFRRLWR